MTEFAGYGDAPRQPILDADSLRAPLYGETEAIGAEDVGGNPPSDVTMLDLGDTSSIGVGDCFPDEINTGRADQATRTDVSVDVSSVADGTDEISRTAETRPQDVVKVKVVPTAHTPENAASIAATVADCQTVVFELAGGTPAERAKIEAAANTLLSDPGIEARFGASFKLDSCGAGYIRATVDRLPKTVGAIKLADIDEQSPAFEAAKQVGQLATAWQAAAKGVVYNDGAGGGRETGDRFIRKCAESSLEREPIMATQVTDVAADIAANTNATPDNPHLIGFVTGSVHPGTAAHLKADGFDVMVVPAPEINPYTGQPVTPIYGDLIRGLIDAGDPNAPIDTAQLDRATVERTFRAFARDSPTAAAIARCMTDEEVRGTLAALDFIRAYCRMSASSRFQLLSTMATKLSGVESTVADRLRRQAGRA